MIIPNAWFQEFLWSDKKKKDKMKNMFIDAVIKQLAARHMHTALHCVATMYHCYLCFGIGTFLWCFCEVVL